MEGRQKRKEGRKGRRKGGREENKQKILNDLYT
jgi:hypothetical protein